MFVADECTLSIGADAARIRLANLIASGLLDTASRQTYLEHGVALLAVGPARGLSRLVQVRMRGLISRGDTTVLQPVTQVELERHQCHRLASTNRLVAGQVTSERGW